MASNLSPMYIAEVAPAHLRGRLVATNQLTIVIGILSAQVVNWLIARPVPDGATAEFIRQSWNGQYGWRWMFTAVTVPSLLFFVGAVLIPESPRWLVKNGLPDRARRVLARIGGADFADAEVADIQSTLSGREIRQRALAGPPRAEDDEDPARRGDAGGAAAVERHQRHLQLRRGDLPRGGLRRQLDHVQHRHHRRGEPRVHAASPSRRWTGSGGGP